MEIRFLNGNEIPLAVNVATEVYYSSVFPYARTPFEEEQFRQYTSVSCLRNEMSGSRLFLWGLFENGVLCAVSAMQNVGHITMMYVRPYCQGRGYGTFLLNAMRSFAVSTLHLSRMTVNVFPFPRADFFMKRGFAQMTGVPNQERYLSMQCFLTAWNGGTGAFPQYGRSMPYGTNGRVIYAQYPQQPPRKKKTAGVTYTTKKVSAKTVLLLVAVVFALLFLIGISYALHHIVVDGIDYTSGTIAFILHLWR